MSSPTHLLATDKYPSNTALYADPALARDRDYRLRHRQRNPRTAVLAPHGGGIEAGTSELCLAVAAAEDCAYWMFEGLRPGDNSDLHVTSAHCDDPTALALCRRATRVLSLHGCRPDSAGLPEDSRAVLVGGLDERLRRVLLAALAEAGFTAFDASRHEYLGGVSPHNICNRNRSGAGGQLEITTALRDAMFASEAPARERVRTGVFWAFVAAVRTGLGRAH
ncbi:poly-gamma-glutamate hydrolase family protein [Saccharopolyspora taberi]|uniref:Replication protein n=1 Tax=Saccharopolyspora taberi TaxID=60895 RepID=A0ABN3VMG7_9PSEU